MDHKQILKETLKVFQECNIHSFPIDCFRVAEHYGYQISKYRDLPEKKQAACLELSEDACIIEDTLYYNDEKPERRVRFSIMHELGHYILNSAEETDANCFASNVLAPRMAIHYSGCKECSEVSDIFLISLEAADYAYQDYRRWHRLAIYRMSCLDQDMYDHFWNEEYGKFVYCETYCYDCEEPIYNQPGAHRCNKCSRKKRQFYKSLFKDELLPDSLSWHGAADCR